MRTIKLCATSASRPTTLLEAIRRSEIELAARPPRRIVQALPTRDTKTALA